jgi:hypothetical protein
MTNDELDLILDLLLDLGWRRHLDGRWDCPSCAYTASGTFRAFDGDEESAHSEIAPDHASPRERPTFPRRRGE